MRTVSIQEASLLLGHLVGEAGWRSGRQAIVEAFPHMSDALDVRDIVQTLENLKIPHSRIECRENRITEGECPALVFPRGQAPYVAVGRSGANLTIWRSTTEQDEDITPSRRVCDLVWIDQDRYDHNRAEVTTVSDAFVAWRPMLPWLLLSSFLVNVLGLLAPLLIMAIYDRVIPTGSEQFLISLGIGVVVILATDFALRHGRTKALAFVGRQGERQLSLALFQKLMGLPLAQLQKSDIDQQLSRFRQFEALRDVFTGQVVTTLLDLPFALIFLGVLFYLTPQVGALTVGVCVFFVALSLIMIPIKTRHDIAVARTTGAMRALVHDAVTHQETIAGLGLKDVWRDRSGPLIEAAEEATRKAGQFQNTMQSLAQTGMAVATLGAILISAQAAMVGDLSFGALIAVIALVSKVLAPIHGLHSNIPQILSFRQSQAQANRVLALAQEMEIGVSQSHQKDLSGSIAFSGVTHRSDPLMPPTLSQVTLSCQPGEVVVVYGSDMIGRRALLDLIHGFQNPLAGSIELDGIDLRQIARDDLRRSISYATFELGLFYGSIAQNFRLAAPTLSDADIADALDAMSLTEDVSDLEGGFETRLTDAVLSELPREFTKALTLARCIARDTPIYLFAEPTVDLGQTKREAFKAWLRSMSGERTVILSTADRSLLDYADRYIFLDGGRVTVNDTGADGLKKIKATLKSRG